MIWEERWGVEFLWNIKSFAEGVGRCVANSGSK